MIKLNTGLGKKVIPGEGAFGRGGLPQNAQSEGRATLINSTRTQETEYALKKEQNIDGICEKDGGKSYCSLISCDSLPACLCRNCSTCEMPKSERGNGRDAVSELSLSELSLSEIGHGAAYLRNHWRGRGLAAKDIPTVLGYTLKRLERSLLRLSIHFLLEQICGGRGFRMGREIPFSRDGRRRLGAAT